MVECELCGRKVKTTQGLRGHKTFFHDIHAGHNKSAEIREKSLNKSEERLEKLTKNIQGINEILDDLKGDLYYLQSRIVSLASRSEVLRIASEVDQLNKQVEKHSRWLNPNGIHEAIVDLDGGPIASIEKKLKGRQSSTN